MFGFLTPVGADAVDPIADVAAADAFWRTLPRDDPIASQVALCEALAETGGRSGPSIDRLQALLALDQRARKLVDGLLQIGVTEHRRAPALATRSWQAAFELCRSFGRAHTQFLGSVRDGTKIQGWREHLPHVVLRLFQHRQVELSLRPFVDERSSKFPWKELHDAYRFAQSRELLHDDLPVNRCYSPSVVDTTLEREYIHVLLQDLAMDGHFPPHDAFWVRQHIPRWTGAIKVEANDVGRAGSRLTIDPDSDCGLARSDAEGNDSRLHLDTAPLVTSICDEILSLRGSPVGPGEAPAPGREREVKLLRKLNLLFAAERPPIARRGERKPMALTVEAIAGMPPILVALRGRADQVAATAPSAGATGEDVTITTFGGFTVIPQNLTGTSMLPSWPSDGADPARLPMTMVDRSDSGCRLHGPTPVSNPIVPGVLIAFRQDVGTPWTLAVVRRVKKRMAGKRLEIGLEYLGSDPRRIVVVIPGGEASAGSPLHSPPPRFAALFLPGSAKRPMLPMKTLVLPARGLAAGDRLSVRSRTELYTIQLKEPLDEQADFIWSPFEILERHRR